ARPRPGGPGVGTGGGPQPAPVAAARPAPDGDRRLLPALAADLRSRQAALPGYLPRRSGAAAHRPGQALGGADRDDRADARHRRHLPARRAPLWTGPGAPRPRSVADLWPGYPR